MHRALTNIQTRLHGNYTQYSLLEHVVIMYYLFESYKTPDCFETLCSINWDRC